MSKISWIAAMCTMVVFGLGFLGGRFLQDDKAVQVPAGSCNICLGYRAGEDITTESYQFCFTIPEMPALLCSHGYGAFRMAEYRVTMTPTEYAVMMNVVGRAKHSWRYLPEKE